MSASASSSLMAASVLTRCSALGPADTTGRGGASPPHPPCPQGDMRHPARSAPPYQPAHVVAFGV